MNSTQHNSICGMQHKNMQQGQIDPDIQNSLKKMNSVSWYSQEEDKKEYHSYECFNWMQSRPEDSMRAHL